MNKTLHCSVCKKALAEDETYEYRGAYACEEHFDEAIEKRDFERAEVIAENRHQTTPFEGLSFGDNPIGRANCELLKGPIEIARKETYRTKAYEGRA
jgi:hypothetical protein